MSRETLSLVFESHTYMTCSVMHGKHFKTVDAEVGSGFDILVITIVPKATTLKADNAQKFNL
eukprot:1183055-Ditylum_brightwellii.AAC.1